MFHITACRRAQLLTSLSVICIAMVCCTSSVKADVNTEEIWQAPGHQNAQTAGRFVQNDVRSTQIGWDDFSGSENWIDFDPVIAEGLITPPVLYEDVLFTENGTGGMGYFRGDMSWDTYFNNQPGASLGLGLADTRLDSWIRMDFNSTVHRVGLLLSTGDPTTWALEAYSADDVLIGSCEGTNSQRDAVFLGLETAGEEIKYIVIDEVVPSNGVTIIDDLRFEAIPEPASLALLAAGGLLVLRRRR